MPSAPQAPERTSSRPWFGSGRQPLAWAFAAAVVAIVIGALNHGPEWRLTGASGNGIVIVDQQPVPINHVDELVRSLTPGTRVRVPAGCQLEITCPGNMVVQITPGTDAVIPGSPGRWFSRVAKGEIKSGELRITTGGGFRGARLVIATPEASILVSGTTLAVICEPQGTCVCVLEGQVRVGPKAGPMAEVESGKRRFVFNDGRPPEAASIRDNELVDLGAFRDQAWSARATTPRN